MKTLEKLRTLDYLDRVKEKLGIRSNYALAKVLKVDESTLNGYWKGKSRMDDTVALKVADILQLNPMEVIAAANIERARNDETRAVWTALLEKISKGFEILLSGASPHGA